jgi:hypothetical protein
LDERQTTPKEMADALNRGVCVELVVTISPALVFLYGGYTWEAAVFVIIASWILLRVALRWTEIKPERM